MPVYKLVEEMPYDEFVKWHEFFETYPEGWREDFRAARIMQSFGTKEPPHKLFQSLAIMHEKEADRKSKQTFDVDGFKRSAFFSNILDAKGGELLEMFK